MAKDRNDYDDQDPQDSAQNSNEFGLTRPTGEIANTPEGDRPPLTGPADSVSYAGPLVPAPLTPEAVEKTGTTTPVWKGFEEEEDYEREISFARQKAAGNEDMDMTPMVDVTFLLLIFFMVTASFTIQKSIEQPPSKSEDPSTQNIEEEDNDEFVQIIIDQYNTYRLTSRNSEEVEAGSDNEMRRRLKDMVDSTRAKKLIILHHGAATHEKVVTAWDAGVNNAIQDIVTQLTEVDF